MSDFDQEVIKEFLVESFEGLEAMERGLLSLEEVPDDHTPLAGIFRCIHSIKGTCGFLAFGTLETISHVGEDLLSQLRDGRPVTPDIINALLAMVDAITEILKNIESTGAEGSKSYDELLTRLKQLQAGDAAKGEEDPHRTTPEAAASDEGPSLDEGASPGSEVSSSGDDDESQSVSEGSIRVDVDLLDRLMNLVGELVLARNQIIMRTSQDEDSTLLAPVQQLNLITTELQEGVMKTRLQPIGNIWSKFPRVVRDLSAKCGKKVRLQMEGRDTELDRTIIEAIKDPLTHIIRNAVDHGIETPEERIAAGKPPEGRLWARAFHEGGQVNIEIADDGGGIDVGHIKDKAIRNGIVTAEVADRMSAKEVINLIFRAGFSTVEQTTSVSGRGVGMDVVRNNIEKVGGTVDLQSTVGRGTVLKLKIPLTLAIIPALIVRTGGDRYAIPQVSLLELVRLEGESARRSIEMVHGAPVYRLRGALLPLVYLNDALQVGNGGRQSRQEVRRTVAMETGTESDREEGAGAKREHAVRSGGEAMHRAGAVSAEDENVVNIVVLQAEDSNFGLVVDAVLDTEEIVVKPLNGQVKSIRAFAGATVAGDGRVALILDVVGLAQQSKVVSELGEDKLSGDTDEISASESDRRSLLVFGVGATGRIAMPLSQVARLEEIPVNSVEYSGRRRVVQYRGEIMRLIWLSEVLQLGEAQANGGEDLQVVVYSHEGRSVGLIVDRIIDVIEEAVHIEERTAGAGIVGSAVVQGLITDMLDAEAVINGFQDSGGRRFDGPVVDAEEESLFDQLGGAPAIGAAVEQFYDLVLADDELAPFFRNTSMDSLKRHQEAFLTQALGGPYNYSGVPMKAAHEHLSIEQHHFDLVAGHLVATLAVLGVGPDLIDEVVAIVAPLAQDIVSVAPVSAT